MLGRIEKDWRWREKTHASSPSTSGKTHEKPSVIQTRNEEVSRRWWNRLLITNGIACLVIRDFSSYFSRSWMDYWLTLGVSVRAGDLSCNLNPFQIKNSLGSSSMTLLLSYRNASYMISITFSPLLAITIRNSFSIINFFCINPMFPCYHHLNSWNRILNSWVCKWIRYWR